MKKNTYIYDKHKPVLKSGDYKIKIDQNLTVVGNALSPDPKEITFRVKGEEYRLDEQQFDSVFPPAGGMGDFSEVLPHVILNRSTLPWENEASDGDTDTPWLALLLFTEDELRKQGPVIEEQEKLNSSSGNEDNPTVNKLHFPDNKDLVSRISTLEEIPFLAHVRGEAEKENEIPVNSKSVIVCNRLPVMGKKNIVHLVSLKDCYEIKTPTTENPSRNRTEIKNNLTSLFSLKSWEFFCYERYRISAEVLESMKQPDGMDNELFIKLKDALSNLKGQEIYGTAKLQEELKRNIDSSPQGITFSDNKVMGLLLQFRIGHLHEILTHLDRTPGYFRLPFHFQYVIDPKVLKSYADETGHIQILGLKRFSLVLKDTEDQLKANLGKHFATADEMMQAVFPDETSESRKSYEKSKKTDPQLSMDERVDLARVNYMLDTFLYLPMAYLAQGYVKMTYQLKSGEEIPAVYRGPLVPSAEANASGAAIVLQHADQAFIYHEPLRVMDVSYASAWQLGRLLALQNKNLSIALYNWKRACYQAYKQNRNSISEDTCPAPPALVQDWFAGIKNLKGIPYNYLVPDDAMIPFESIRFFSLDERWLKHLIDGAYSLGRISELDRQCDTAVYEIDAASFLRTESLPKGGMLLHSVAVAGWPGLVVSDQVSNSPSFEAQLSPNMKYFLFSEQLSSVSISQHPGSIHFGKSGNENFFKSDGLKSLDFYGTDLQNHHPAEVVAHLIQNPKRITFVL